MARASVEAATDKGSIARPGRHQRSPVKVDKAKESRTKKSGNYPSNRMVVGHDKSKVTSRQPREGRKGQLPVAVKHNKGAAIENIATDPGNVELEGYHCFLCMEDFDTLNNYYHHCERKNEVPLHCPRCDNQYKHYFTYRQHMWIHTGQKPYKCAFCEKAFRIEDAMLNHEKTHRKKQPSKVRKGGDSETVGCSFSGVTSTIQSERLNKSGIDDKPVSFTKTAEVQDEEEEEGNDDGHDEDEEDMGEEKQEDMDSRVTLGMHAKGTCSTRLVADTASSYQRRISGVGHNVSSNQVQRDEPLDEDHIVPSPDDLELYRCFSCQEDFGTLKDYYSHCKTNNEEPFYCTICDKSYKSYFAYRQHMWTHTGQKPYKCSFCKRAFRVKDTMEQHEVAHKKRQMQEIRRGVKEPDFGYRCFLCQEDFDTLQEYYQHCDTKKETPLHCPKCNIQHKHFFAYRHHMWKHTGEKPYKCAFCEKSFRLKECMALHEKVYHEKQLEEMRQATERGLYSICELPIMLEDVDVKNKEEDDDENEGNVDEDDDVEDEDNADSVTDNQKTPMVTRRQSRINQMRSIAKRNGKGNSILKVKITGTTRNDEELISDLKGYSCFLCREVFDTLREYHNHCEVTKETPLHCPKCDIQHEYYFAYRQHMWIHTGQKPYKCSYCKKAFRIKDSMVQHEKTHQQKNDERLPIIWAETHQKIKMNMQEDEDDENVGSKSSNQGSGADALKDTSGQESDKLQRIPNNSGKMAEENDVVGQSSGPVDLEGYRCFLCPENFDTLKEYYRHCEIKQEVPFYCPMCDKDHKFYCSYRQHMWKHTGQRPYKCSFCKRAFRVKDTMVQHERSHGRMQARRTKQKSLDEATVSDYNAITVCFICGSGFDTMRKLHYHANVHLDGFLCAICGKDLTEDKDRDAHMIQHAGERQYQCKTCDEVMSSFELLNDHSREHAHLMAYACCSCDKTFSLPRDLAVHFSTKHYGTPEDDGRISAKAAQMQAEQSTYRCYSCMQDFETLVEYRKHCQLNEETPNHCAICNTTFAQYFMLRNHMRIHTGEKPYSCSFCNRSYRLKGSLVDHEKQHHSVTFRFLPDTETGMANDEAANPPISNRYRCYTCEEDMPTLEEYKQHCKRNRETAFSCKQCLRTLSSYFKYVQHMRKHTGEKPFVCKFCGKGFRVKDFMVCHMQLHVIKSNKDGHLYSQGRERRFFKAGKHFMCYQCNVVYKTPKEYMDHCNEQHEGHLFHCPTCDRSLARYHIYQSHMLNHLGVKPYQCPLCKMRFVKEYSLKQHQRRHAGENTYICNICGVTRTTKAYFRRHMSTHTNQWTYKCETCDKGFFEETQYKIHLAEHAGGWPHKCRKCKKPFTEAHLRRHEAGCGTQKSIICEKCGKTFRRKRKFVSHMQIVHRELDNVTKVTYDNATNELVKKKTVVQCPHCPRVFGDRHGLHRHSFTHSKEKRFMCEICKRGFSYKDCWLSHMKTHDKPEKAFKCDQCWKSYSTNLVLTRHKRSKHDLESGVQLPPKSKLPPSGEKKKQDDEPGKKKASERPVCRNRDRKSPARKPKNKRPSPALEEIEMDLQMCPEEGAAEYYTVVADHDRPCIDIDTCLTMNNVDSHLPVVVESVIKEEECESSQETVSEIIAQECVRLAETEVAVEQIVEEEHVAYFETIGLPEGSEAITFYVDNIHYNAA